jgi:hypothetical protein
LQRPIDSDKKIPRDWQKPPFDTDKKIPRDWQKPPFDTDKKGPYLQLETDKNSQNGLSADEASQNGRVLNVEQAMRNLTANDPRQSHDLHRQQSQDKKGTDNQAKDGRNDNGPQHSASLADLDSDNEGHDADDVLHDGAKKHESALLGQLNDASVLAEAKADDNLSAHIGNYLNEDRRAREKGDGKAPTEKPESRIPYEQNPKLYEEFKRQERMNQVANKDQNLTNLARQIIEMEKAKQDFTIDQNKIRAAKDALRPQTNIEKQVVRQQPLPYAGFGQK